VVGVLRRPADAPPPGAGRTAARWASLSSTLAGEPPLRRRRRQRRRPGGLRRADDTDDTPSTGLPGGSVVSLRGLPSPGRSVVSLRGLPSPGRSVAQRGPVYLVGQWSACEVVDDRYPIGSRYRSVSCIDELGRPTELRYNAAVCTVALRLRFI